MTEEQKKQAERLLEAVKAAGYDGPTEAARDNNWPVSTFLSHANGNRAISIDQARKYAKGLKVSLAWLVVNEGPMKGPMIDSELAALGKYDPETSKGLTDSFLQTIKTVKNRFKTSR